MSKALFQRIFREFKSTIRLAKAGRSAGMHGKLSRDVKIVGFLSSSIGLGEAARKQVRLLKKVGIETESVDVTQKVIPTMRGLEANHQSDTPESSPFPPGIVIYHMNPPELPKALDVTRSNSEDYRVGYWVYEIDPVPVSWRFAARLVHEVWTPSHFSAEALRKSIRCDVHVLPLPISLATAKPDMRARLGLDLTTFVVLLSYDTKSCIARKNPYASVAAFKIAFQGNEDVSLVIKISEPKGGSQALEALRKVVGNDGRIRIISQIIAEEEMAGLYEMSDAILSMHRSEGFGLSLAEGMARGKPVIATGWSGNTDYMNDDVSLLVPYKLIKVRDEQGIYGSGIWADPDVDAAVERLKHCYNNREQAKLLGARAKLHVEEFLGKGLEEKYAKRLRGIALNNTTDDQGVGYVNDHR